MYTPLALMYYQHSVSCTIYLKGIFNNPFLAIYIGYCITKSAILHSVQYKLITVALPPDTSTRTAKLVKWVVEH